MAQLDRTKHDFDILEHVFGGIHATTADDGVGLVTCAGLQPEAIAGSDRDIEIVILEGRG